VIAGVIADSGAAVAVGSGGWLGLFWQGCEIIGFGCVSFCVPYLLLKALNKLIKSLKKLCLRASKPNTENGCRPQRDCEPLR